MERFISKLQVAFAAFIILFATTTILRCILSGSDAFYIFMFALIGLLGRAMLRVSIKEYKELKHGDNERNPVD